MDFTLKTMDFTPKTMGFTPKTMDVRDGNGIGLLKINRVEIARDDQLSPYYFMASDTDDTQQHLNRTGKLEHRLEVMRRNEWHGEIMGTDDQTGKWDYGSQTTGQRKRNDNLDACARHWLLNLQLTRKLRDPHATIGTLDAMIVFMTVHVESMDKLRLVLVLVINIVVCLFTQDRDKIQRIRNEKVSEVGEGNAQLNLFALDMQWAHNLVVAFGAITLALSVCSAVVTIKEQGLMLMAQASIEKEEARMIHNGDFRRPEHKHKFTQERTQTGRTKLNCYGVVHVVRFYT